MAKQRRPNRANANARPVRQKLVIVGDGACGKTCLLRRFALGDYNDDAYVPTVFENYVADLTLPSGLTVELTLWDTAGQEDYDRLRPLSYPDGDVILIAFAVDNPDSLGNVSDKWITEVRHCCAGVPVLLVALKTDLRGDRETVQRLRAKDGRGTVTAEEGLKAANELAFDAYLECSSKTGEGVDQVFKRAGVLALGRNRKSRSGGCAIL